MINEPSQAKDDADDGGLKARLTRIEEDQRAHRREICQIACNSLMRDCIREQENRRPYYVKECDYELKKKIDQMEADLLNSHRELYRIVYSLLKEEFADELAKAHKCERGICKTNKMKSNTKSL